MPPNARLVVVAERHLPPGPGRLSAVLATVALPFASATRLVRESVDAPESGALTGLQGVKTRGRVRGVRWWGRGAAMAVRGMMIRRPSWTPRSWPVLTHW